MADPVKSMRLIVPFPEPIAMWMSNVLIVVDRNNPDHNSLTDLAGAVKETGADVINIDEHNLVIEADLPTHEVVTVAAMDGVAYVRSVFSYFKDQTPQEAA
jgi:seryl-tRNA(Sec) selenium transferase